MAKKPTYRELEQRVEGLKNEADRCKRAQEALKTERERLFALFDGLPAYVYLQAPDHSIRFANRSFRERFGEPEGRACYQVITGRDKPCKTCRPFSVFETGRPIEWEWVRGDGRTYQIYDYPFSDTDGSPLVLELGIDVTARKHAEEALRRSENKYKTLLEHLPQKIFHKNTASVYLSCNENYAQDLNIKPEEIQHKTDYDFFPRSLAEKYRTDDKRIIASGKTEDIEEQYLQNGQEMWVQTVKTPIKDEKGDITGVLGIFWDITKRKRAEEALRRTHDELELRVKERTAQLSRANEQLKREIDERKRTEKELKASEQKYHLLFSQDPNPLFVVDMDSGKILDVNNAAMVTYQYAQKELLEMYFLELFDAEEAGSVSDSLGELHEDVYVFIPRVWAKKKDGRHFFTHLHAQACGFKELEDGDVRRCLIVRTVDITRRLEQAAQLTQASKMATLGEMATGIAHELNQPLNVIKVGADFFAKKIRRGEQISDDEVLKVSCNISEQVNRASNIINHLRDFGRKSELRVYPVELNDPIRDVFTLLGQQLKLRDMEVDLRLDEGLPKILADRNQLEQIFLNLVTNARDAMEAKGPETPKKLTITTSREGAAVVARVWDTGTGMPEGIRKKIFEPFFTTKEAGKGTGLGLSITYNLVKNFKGNIEVESVPDLGTTFKISFPVYEEEGHRDDEAGNH
jgi:PAS domain S-box-containing protein